MDTYKRGRSLFQLISFLRGLIFYSGVIVPFLTVWGKLSQFEVQTLQAWFMLTAFLLEVPTGVIADKWGAKASVILGYLFSVAGVLFYAIYPNLYIFMLGEFLLAMGKALNSGADEALMYEFLRRHDKIADMREIRGDNRSLYMIGMFISAPIGTWIASQWGLQAPMAATSIPALLTLIVALFLPGNKTYNTQPSKPQYGQILREGVKYTLKHQEIIRITCNLICIHVAGYFVIWLCPQMLTQLGFSITWLGYAQASLVFVQVIVFQVEKRIKFMSGHPLMFPIAAVCVGSSYVLLAWQPSLISVVLFIIFAGGFGLTRREMISAMINEVIDSDYRATVLSTISMAQLIVIAIINPIIGLLADQSLSYALFVLGLVPFLSLLFPLAKK